MARACHAAVGGRESLRKAYPPQVTLRRTSMECNVDLRGGGLALGSQDPRALVEYPQGWKTGLITMNTSFS